MAPSLMRRMEVAPTDKLGADQFCERAILLVLPWGGQGEGRGHLGSQSPAAAVPAMEPAQRSPVRRLPQPRSYLFSFSSASFVLLSLRGARELR